MDLHPPEQPIRTFKDFALHLCVVTVGILIALGPEQVVEAHHRASVAREAVEGFRRPYDTVKKFSQAYTNLRVFSDEERIMLSAWHDLQAFGEDLSAMTPDQRRGLAGQLHRYDSFTFSLDSSGQEVFKAADEALR